jgi:recombination protein RecA
VVKNKIAPPFRDAEFDIMFDRGISYEGDLLDLAALGNIVEKSGAWYNYKATRLGQGRENAKQILFENKDLAEEIRQAVLSSKGLVEIKKATEAPLSPEEDKEEAGE